MDEARARELLQQERTRVEGLLGELEHAQEEGKEAASEVGDMADPAEPLTEEEGAEAVAVGLRARLAAVQRAEARVEAGTYGRSVKSGTPIPDERLEADPAAELTVEEEVQEERGPPL
jgi:DnaK suppressor protein